MEELRFDGRTVLVTGAGRGLGREYALLLAARGAHVVVNDLVAGGQETGPADAVVDEIVSLGGRACADAHDISTPAGGAAAVATALETFGQIDVVINNAGVIRHELVGDITDAALNQTIDVNLKGAIYVARAAWPHLKAQRRGRIVNATSSAGLVGNANAATYGSTKAGLVGLTRVLALEGMEHGIAANAVAPLAVTKMTEGLELPGWMPDTMDPRLVAPVVAWLAHESCSVSGEVLSAGGGRVARYFVGLTDGYRDPDLTPEDVRDNLDLILSLEDSIVPRHPSDEFALLASAQETDG